jgi:hypothetical protein
MVITLSQFYSSLILGLPFSIQHGVNFPSKIGVRVLFPILMQNICYLIIKLY